MDLLDEEILNLWNHLYKNEVTKQTGVDLNDHFKLLTQYNPAFLFGTSLPNNWLYEM